MPDCCSRRSTRVVLPWSTWAMMATLRRLMALLLVVQRVTRALPGNPGPTFPDRALKPGILARDDASSNRHPAPSFLFEHNLQANAYRVCPEGKPVPTFPDHAPGALSPKKETRPKGTGHTLRVAAQYIQKTPKNNGLFGIWLADFAHGGRLIALFGVGIDPPQHLVKMGYDRLIATAGPAAERIRV